MTMLAAGTVILRFLTELGLLGLFGILSLDLYAPAAFRAVHPRRWILSLAGLGVLASAATIPMLAAQMSGELFGGLDRQTLKDVAFGTAAGLALLGRIGLLGLCLAGTASLWSGCRSVHLVVTVLSGCAVLSLGFSGHSAAGEGAVGWVRLLADGLHALAAGVWLGALVGFLAMARSRDLDRDRELHHALQCFSGVGSFVVGALVITGAFNTAFSTSGMIGLSSLDPGWLALLIAKLVLFGAMLALVALHRFRLTPALLSSDRAGQAAAIRQLRQTLLLETTVGVAILVIVAVLGRLAPLSAN
jgi:putative copper resistance protein D